VPKPKFKGGGKKRKIDEMEPLGPPPLSPEELEATKSVYTLEQVARLGVDIPSFVFCMQNMKLLANKLCCGRYLRVRGSVLHAALKLRVRS
jgi:hypothetical protein